MRKEKSVDGTSAKRGTLLQNQDLRESLGDLSLMERRMIEEERMAGFKRDNFDKRELVLQ